MKTKDKEFISEIVSSDFKHISNQNFTRDTLEKISILENNMISHSYSGDLIFIIPVLIYVSIFFLLSFIPVLFSWIQLEQIDTILHPAETILGYLLHPVAFSILLSFSLLYLFDLFLKKLDTKISKHNPVSSR